MTGGIVGGSNVTVIDPVSSSIGLRNGSFLNMSTLVSNIEFFCMSGYLIIDTKKYKMPKSLGKSVCLIIFKRCGLENPDCDPIGVYYEGGIRRYMWRKTMWNGVDYDMNNIIKQAIRLSNARLISQSDLDFIADFAVHRNNISSSVMVAAIKPN